MMILQLNRAQGGSDKLERLPLVSNEVSRQSFTQFPCRESPSYIFPMTRLLLIKSSMQAAMASGRSVSQANLN